MILGTTIAIFVVAFLPSVFLVLRKEPRAKTTLPSGLHIDVQGIINRLFIDKRQQQPVLPQHLVRPASYSYVISIVDEQPEFGGNNHWLFAKADEIRQIMRKELIVTQVCAN